VGGAVFMDLSNISGCVGSMQEKAEKHKRHTELTDMDRVSQDPSHLQLYFNMQPRMGMLLHSVVSRQIPKFGEGSEKNCSRSRDCQQIHSCNYKKIILNCGNSVKASCTQKQHYGIQQCIVAFHKYT